MPVKQISFQSQPIAPMPKIPVTEDDDAGLSENYVGIAKQIGYVFPVAESEFPKFPAQ